MVEVTIRILPILVVVSLPCISQSFDAGTIFDSYQNLIWNKRFADNILDWMQPITLLNCAKECIRFGGCRSFNYISKLSMCDINIGDHETHPASFKSFVGSVYGQRKNLDKMILNDDCINMTCNTGYKCSEGWNGTACSAKACHSAPSIPHSDLKFQHTRIGYGAQYTCHSGYYVSDGSGPHLQCYTNASWEDNFACTPIPCPAPSAVENAHVNSSDVEVGGKSTYACNDGYRLTGSNVITCNHGPSWSAVTFTCLNTCPTTPAAANAHVTSTSPNVGDKTIYACNAGYRMSGSNAITCNYGPVWSQPAFTCLNTCPTPPAVANAHVTSTSPNVGDKTIYACNAGYRMSGSNGIMCNYGPVWSATAFTCLNTCLDPPAVGNAYVAYKSVQPGGTAAYICHGGYRQYGSNVITCLFGPRWSSVAFSCVKFCSPPHGISHGYYEPVSGSYNHGSIVTYKCNFGYFFRGHNQITCHSNGHWGSLEGSCKLLGLG